jgi:biotin carboxyl carrier protein
MYIVKTGSSSFDFTPEAQGTWKSPQASGAIRIEGDSRQGFRLHVGKENFAAFLVEADYRHKRFVFSIQNRRIEVLVEDEKDQIIKALGLTVVKQKKVDVLKSPMPGMVLEVLTKPGQTVSKGEPLLILEAMKMENVLRAAGEGEVKEVLVEAGTAVDKNQVLIKFVE